MLSQDQILRKKDGNVCLYEDDHQTHLEVRPIRESLPVTSPAKTAFHNNPYFIRALTANKQYVAFQSVTGHSVLIAPTKSYASIRVFAKYATAQEWQDLWRFVYEVRHQMQQAFGGFYYISTIGLHVPQLHIRLERRPDVKYMLDLDSIALPDQSLILKYANDPNGWTHRYKCSIAKGSKDESDVQVAFASPEELSRAFGPDNAKLSISLVDVSAHPSTKPTIYFNVRNWNCVPERFTGSLSTYRKYLVQHECGHALFHVWNHDESPASGTCPVMMQQTKGTASCEPGVHHHPHTWTPPVNTRIGDWLFAMT